MASLLVYCLDDEPDLLELFVEAFSNDKVTVKPFLTTDSAFKAINDKRPDLILIDYRLHGTTGDKFAMTIDPTIKKALITGELTVKLQCHFDAVFFKPFKIEEIEKFIQDTLRSQK